MAIVDEMLETQSRMLPLRIVRPFSDSRSPDAAEFWDACQEWLAGQKERNMGRAIVFRFLRYLKPDAEPLNRHWTTADYVDGNILHLFDCSHEAEAILNIRKESFVTRAGSVDKEHLLYIQPQTARFLRLPF